MKYQKIVVALALCCCCLLAFDSFAQGRRGGHGPFKLIEANKADLQITSEQEEKLLALKEEMKAFHKEARAEARANENTDRRAVMNQIREKVDQELALILSEEQMTNLTALKAERLEAKKAERAEHLKTKAKFKQERKAYFEKNQLPVLQAQRAKLESAISDEDKVLIQNLRTAFETQKAQKKEERKARQDALSKGETKESFSGKRPPRGKKNQLHRMFANEEDRNTALALVEKYDEQIEALHAEISEQEKQWKADHKKAKKAHYSENGKTFKAGARKGRGHGKGKGRRDRKEKKELQRKVKFLLIEPNSTTLPNQLTIVDHQLKAYPNPATNQQTIEFELKQSGMVTVELLDKEGRLIKSIFQGQLEAGTQQMNVDLEELNGYVFYYRITDQEGTSSLKVLLKSE